MDRKKYYIYKRKPYSELKIVLSIQGHLTVTGKDYCNRDSQHGMAISAVKISDLINPSGP